MQNKSMPAVFKRIIIIVLVAIMAPVLFFIIYRINDLNENERILQNIYQRQLDVIIFSINQYSNDMMSNLAKDMEHINALDSADENTLQNLSIRWLAWDLDSTVHIEYVAHEERNNPDKPTEVKRIFESNREEIERLKRYQNTGYQKLEPLGNISDSTSNIFLLLFVTRNLTPALIAFDAELFAEDMLAPKLQEIAREDIAVAVIDTINQTTVYATDSLDTEDTFMKPVWLLPGYQVGLSLQGNSLTQLVRQRADNNIVIASIMLGLMAIGVWLIVRNLLKEMRLAQTKSDFVANVSHEIRTPLALISMFAETLVMDRVPSEEKKKEYYNIIIKETARLRNIVNKILNFSQIEAKKKQYHFEAIDVNKIVLQVVDTYEFHLRSKGFEYELKLQPRDMVIEADEEAVVETLINLIDNAIKYSDKEKHIEISTFVKNDKVAIALTDRGIGIPKNLQGQVFDKFYRVTSKNVYHTMGTGLGLTLVKNIMTAHQGDVEVESKPGEGSTFTLWFPIKQQENA